MSLLAAVTVDKIGKASGIILLLPSIIVRAIRADSVSHKITLEIPMENFYFPVGEVSMRHDDNRVLVMWSNVMGDKNKFPLWKMLRLNPSFCLYSPRLAKSVVEVLLCRTFPYNLLGPCIAYTLPL